MNYYSLILYVAKYSRSLAALILILYVFSNYVLAIARGDVIGPRDIIATLVIAGSIYAIIYIIASLSRSRIVDAIETIFQNKIVEAIRVLSGRATKSQIMSITRLQSRILDYQLSLLVSRNIVREDVQNGERYYIAR